MMAPPRSDGGGAKTVMRDAGVQLSVTSLPALNKAQTNCAASDCPGNRACALARDNGIYGSNGVTRFVELGTGKVLSGLAKRAAPEAEILPWIRWKISVSL